VNDLGRQLLLPFSFHLRLTCKVLFFIFNIFPLPAYFRHVTNMLSVVMPNIFVRLFLKNYFAWAWWCTPIIPTMWEVVLGGLWFEAGLGQKPENLCEE
jgi:hypothetical protein